MRSQLLAMSAGCLGATASATGKLGMDGEHVTAFCNGVTRVFYDISSDKMELILSEDEIFVTQFATIVIRGLLLLLTFSLNAVMWSLFMESMQNLNSGEAVVLNTGTNIIISAVFGSLIFGEVLSFLWWVGASFILAGMVILQSSSGIDGKIQKIRLRMTNKMK